MATLQAWIATLAFVVLLGGCSEQAKSDDEQPTKQDSSKPPRSVAGAGSMVAPRTSAEPKAPAAGAMGPAPRESAGRDLGEDAGPREKPPNGELCDGMDNDRNGRIDDVDIESDGVCDCLRIASIGAGGVWGGQSVFRSWPNNRAQNPVIALGDRVLTDELLEPYHVIVLLDVAATPDGVETIELPPHHMFSAEEVAAFERWVRAGGGVATTIGYRAPVEVDNVNRLLAPFGMGYSTTDADLHGYVETWQAHPVTAGVRKILTQGGVRPDGSAGLTLARDSLGRAALQVTQTPDARIVVWGDEWITYDTQWQAREDQQVEPLWLNLLSWLSPSVMCQAAPR